MDEETIKRAKLLSAVFCRAIEFHAVTVCIARAADGKSAKVLQPAKEDAESAVTVALENLLDELDEVKK